MGSITQYVIFVIGLAVVLVGADLFVRAAIRLAALTKQSRLLIGLTVVALGTSAPELAIGVIGTIRGTADVGLGNIVGSNIFNLLFILGVAALIRPLVVNQKVIKRDIPILLVIGIGFFLMALDKRLQVAEAILLFGLLIGYLVYLSRVFLKREGTIAPELMEFSGERFSGKQLMWNLLLAVFAIFLLTLGSRWTVDSATSIAIHLGISELAIGLTLVAVGTSLPELATTLVAVRKNEPDLAMGNIMGSCIFNITLVPATMTLVKFAPLSLSDNMVYMDVPIMVLATLVCLPVFFSSYKISRPEGLLFLIYYAMFILLLFIRESSFTASGESGKIIIILGGFMVLATVITVTGRAFKYRRSLQKSGGDS